MRRIPLVAFLLLAGAGVASACSCAGNVSECAAYWNTPLLFRGRVTSITVIPDKSVPDGMVGPGTLEVHFAVLEKFRGDAGSEMVVRTPSQSSACGVEFKDGAEYLVHGYTQGQGDWWTNKCSRTHEIVNAEEDTDLQWLHSLATANPGGTIFGTARQLLPDFENNGYQNQPIPGVVVHIKGPEDRTAKTNVQGDYSVSGLPPGKYQVTPEFPSGLGPPTPSEASVHDKGCAEVHFFAQNDAIVEGNLFNADLTPAKGAFLRLKRIQEGNTPAWTHDNYVVNTDDAGHFHFEPVQPGAYVLGVNVDFPAHGGPFRDKNFYPGKPQQEQAEVIHIVGAQRLESLRYVLPAEPQAKEIAVRVKVVLPDGAAGSNVGIELWNPQWPDFHWGPQAKVDAQGWYLIELPENELYNLFARGEDPAGNNLCAGPSAVAARPEMQPIVLVLREYQGKCFDKHLTELPQQ